VHHAEELLPALRLDDCLQEAFEHRQRMSMLLRSLQDIFENTFNALIRQFPFDDENNMPVGDSFCWSNDDKGTTSGLYGSTTSYNTYFDTLMELDPELDYMKKMHLTTWESILMYASFAASFICFLHASFVLMEALIVFGLQRCRQKLQAWNMFVASKHWRL